MDGFLKAALIGVVGYVAYEYLFGTAATATTTAASTSSSITPTGTVSTASNVSGASAVKSGGQVAAYAASNAQLTSSQWNYYQSADVPGSNIILGGISMPNPISFAQWQALFSTPGVIVGPQPPAGTSGMGFLLDLARLPQPTTIGWGVGDDEFEQTGLGILIGARTGSLNFHGHGKGGMGILEDDSDNNASYVDQGPFFEAWAAQGGLDTSTEAFYLAQGLPDILSEFPPVDYSGEGL